jgi:hypothetical protein
MFKITMAIVASTLLLQGCSKNGAEFGKPYHVKTTFIQGMTGQPLVGTPIWISKVNTDPCSGWGCVGDKSIYWGQLLTDAHGMIDIDETEKSTFQFQSDEDSLWNPYPETNPSFQSYSVRHVEQTCYLFPVTMLTVSLDPTFAFGVEVESIPTAGIPHFSWPGFDHSETSFGSATEPTVHLLRGVESLVKFKYYHIDGSTSDTSIKITPMTGEKLHLNLPF